MFKIMLTLVLGVVVAMQLAPAQDQGDADKKSESHEKTEAVTPDVDDPGVVITPQELLDMLYANDPGGPPHPNEDGSIPLTRDRMKQLLFGPGPFETDEASQPHEAVESGPKGIVTARLTTDQMLDMRTRMRTSIEPMRPKFANRARAFSGRNGRSDRSVAQPVPRRARLRSPQVDSLEAAGDNEDGPSPLLAENCAFRLVCDRNHENCRLECSGSCPSMKICAEVTVPRDDGGFETSCNCIVNPL